MSFFSLCNVPHLRCASPRLPVKTFLKDPDEAEEWQLWKTSKLFPIGKPVQLVS